MGVEAFVYALPQLAKAALKNKRDNFEVLAKLNYRYFTHLDLSQREALRWLLEFCRSSEFGRRDEQARITENLSFLEMLGDRADYPPPIGTEQDAAEQPATAGESK